MNRSIELEPHIHAEELPEIIQGGMGVAVSNWRLAGEVARNGELGVISGTAIGLTLARRLQDGDVNSKMVLEKYFPDQDISLKILEKYFIEGGKQQNHKYKNVPMLSHKPNKMAEDLNVAGAFIEVTLAKEVAQGNGHVGMNMLTKLEEPTISALYGAMLADVDAVIMGAGIPKHIPGILDDLTLKRPTKLALTVVGAENIEGGYHMFFNPEQRYPELYDKDVSRPNFLAIISINSLATYLAKKDNPPDGFVVEHWTAGGHNAPPRNRDIILNERGEPVYGPKDIADIEKLERIGLPYWMAGSFGSPDRFQQAKNGHARGVQIGSAFALSQESGMSHHIKLRIVESIMRGDAIDVYTDPLASPTGYPFKVAGIDDTLSENDVYKSRDRICDLGYLREKYLDDVTVRYRCPSEPIETYQKKGGSLKATIGRKCICNALMSTIEMPQIKKFGTAEPPIVTMGDDVNRVVPEIMKYLGRSLDTGRKIELYSAKDVINYMRSRD